ncbi:multiple sugar transport system permease protein [Butyrivibrio fibrisolvens DSM 3071]|uniref:Multiple sugar transport system permease protein n=2 Tax=Butyrivibrio fibrisolvens TaxID=831 RepID=A0A1M5V309_BUTFI|nr:carbohydrate ABC transporter permease [Butyrivibrio fibrisolvens]SHH69596.1 multiple sugar transport system permease protein [Butyrivibrio fibrisolvens DSM 3071]
MESIIQETGDNSSKISKKKSGEKHMAKTGSTKNKMHRTTGDIVLEVCCYIFFIFAAIVCVYPFYYIIINTISANDLSQRGVILFLPQEIHFHNYASVLKVDGLAQASMISVLRTGIGSLLTVSASSYLGYMFAQRYMWAKKFWYRLVVATMYFNAGIIPWFLTMKNLGLTNNFLGYILPTIVSPFFIILTKTFVEGIPGELSEAAELDGAGVLKTFFHVMLPVMKPIMATIAIFAAVNQWNAFQDTLLLVTDSKLYSLQFLLYQYLNQASSLSSLANNSSSNSLAAAAATMQTATSIRMTITVIVVIPIMLVYPIFQRYFVKGIMIGAVKG